MPLINITLEQISLLAPNARAVYKTAFANADAVLVPYGINANKLRLAHFMAQMLHESGALTILEENMNYTARRICQVWPSRFANEEAARPYAHNPEKLANKVYGGRMGNDQPGDGWRYRGRGMLQCTGKVSYAKFSLLVGADLVANPDLVAGDLYSLKVACEEWKEKGCNAIADQDNIRAITRRINGGLIGLASREDWLVKTKRTWR